MKRTTFSLIAPGLLALIATVQIFTAITQSLSAWKGGGFGMFSTVDAPSARYVKIYLITPEEEIPVAVPESLLELYRRVRTMPNDRNMMILAQAVADGTWVPYRMLAPSEDYYSQTAISPPESDPSGDTEFIPFADLGFYRMLSENEMPPSTADIVSFDHVRVELWRYEFQSDVSQLTTSIIKVIEAPVH